MTGFIIVLLIVLLVVIISKSKKQERHGSEYGGNNYYKRHDSDEQHTTYDLKYDSINIMTKKARKEHTDFTVIDFETTGLRPQSDKIVEIGAVKIRNGEMIDSFSSLVNPKYRIPQEATRIHGITDKMVKGAPTIESILPQLIDFIGEDVIVAHNAPFDMKFLLINAQACGINVKAPVIDTLALCRTLYPDSPNHKLGTVAEYLNIDLEDAHRSLSDVTATANILIKSIAYLNKQDKAKEQERKLAREAAAAIAERENNE